PPPQASDLPHLGGRRLGSPCPAPALVQRPPPGGGEQPRPPGILAPAEAIQAPDHRDPGLRRDVLGGPGGDHLQVTQQSRVAVPPQDRKCALIPPLRRRQDGREVLTDHHSSLAPAAAARDENTDSTPDRPVASSRFP